MFVLLLALLQFHLLTLVIFYETERLYLLLIILVQACSRRARLKLQIRHDQVLGQHAQILSDLYLRAACLLAGQGPVLGHLVCAGFPT